MEGEERKERIDKYVDELERKINNARAFVEIMKDDEKPEKDRFYNYNTYMRTRMLLQFLRSAEESAEELLFLINADDVENERYPALKEAAVPGFFSEDLIDKRERPEE